MMRIFRTVSFLLMAAFAAELGLQSMQLSGSTRVYPQVFIVAVLVGTLLAAGRALFIPSDDRMPGEIAKLAALPASGRARLAAFVVLWLVYPWALSEIGFIVATSVALALSLILLDVRRVVIVVLGSIAFSLVLAVLFSTVFYIPTPSGYIDDQLTHLLFNLSH